MGQSANNELSEMWKEAVGYYSDIATATFTFAWGLNRIMEANNQCKFFLPSFLPSFRPAESGPLAYEAVRSPAATLVYQPFRNLESIRPIDLSKERRATVRKITCDADFMVSSMTRDWTSCLLLITSYSR